MKKLMQCSCIFALVAFATSAFALNSGSWDLTTGLHNGTWGEQFNPTPGSPGSLVSAGDLAQWNLASFTLVAATGLGGDWYDTTYNLGTITLGTDASTWGTGGTITGMTLLNHSHFTTVSGVNYLDSTFTATGIYLGQTVNFAGTFIGDTGTLSNYHITANGQGGTEFTTLRISVVPDGGSVLVMLGVALSMIGLLRRKLVA